MRAENKLYTLQSRFSNVTEQNIQRDLHKRGCVLDLIVSQEVFHNRSDHASGLEGYRPGRISHVHGFIVVRFCSRRWHMGSMQEAQGRTKGRSVADFGISQGRSY